ncbi:hypothetical protein VTH06DRAFT_6773 [Thermothelomyces fergusii]
MPTDMEKDFYATEINQDDWEQYIEYPSVSVSESDSVAAVAAPETDLLGDCALENIDTDVAQELTADCLGDGSGEAYISIEDEEGISIPHLDPFDAFTEPNGQQEPADVLSLETGEYLDLIEANGLDELGHDLAACFLIDNNPATDIDDNDANAMFHSLRPLIDETQNPSMLSGELPPSDGRVQFDQPDMAHAFQHDQLGWVTPCNGNRHWQMADGLPLPSTDAGVFQGVDGDLPQHTPAWVCYNRFPPQICSPPPLIVIQNFISVGTMNVASDCQDKSPNNP